MNNEFARKVISPAMVILASAGVFVQSIKPALAAPKMAPGSYMKHRVNGTAGLAKEVAGDSRLARLYEGDFHMSRGNLLKFIQTDLKEVALKKVVRARVHYLNKFGHETAKMETLHTGTIVFAQRETGIPVIKEDCGNFLGNHPKKPVHVAKKPVVKKLAAQVPVVPVPSAPVLTPSPFVPATPAAASPYSFAAPSSSPLAALPAVSNNNNFPFFPVLATAGIAVLVSGGNDNNPGNTSGGNPSPVPEAPTSASLGLMLLGGLGYMAHRKRTPAPRQ